MSVGERLRRFGRFVASSAVDARLGIPGLRKAGRIASRAVYIGDGVVLSRVLGRYIMYLPARDMSVVPGLLIHGSWERWVTRTLATRLRPGMVVGDVGANVGYFTAMMADRVGASGHVHAFEANADLAALIERSMFVNGFTARTTIHPVALGEEDGREMLLCLPGDALGGAAIRPSPGYAVPDSRPVTTRRLDTIPGAERIELLKIDAEGSEAAIWAGMTGLLAGRTLRTVMLEFSAGYYPDAARFLDEIAAAGFAIALIDYRSGTRRVTRDWLLDPVRADETLMLLLTR